METNIFEPETLPPQLHEIEDPAQPAFCIDSAERANWLVRRVIEARAYGDRVRTWAAKEQRRAEREEAQLMYLFGRQLQDWVVQDLATQRGRRKSVSLPAGTVGFRRVGLKLRIQDRAAVLDWARATLPQAVVTREFLSKTAINDHFSQTGEIPSQGVVIDPEHEAFFIR